MAILSDSVMPLAADWAETQLPCSPSTLAGSDVAAKTLRDLEAFETNGAALGELPAKDSEKGDGPLAEQGSNDNGTADEVAPCKSLYIVHVRTRLAMWKPPRWRRRTRSGSGNDLKLKNENVFHKHRGFFDLSPV